jgi:hypothetical protein
MVVRQRQPDGPGLGLYSLGTCPARSVEVKGDGETEVLTLLFLEIINTD